ncbi:M20/M25/M40 family metallo-hydrolase [Bacillus sp. Xin]|uniref:M28 family metallopeptidase n=1 Tax=unclassified Bacillus (in: firmicutes) TaxID=185979 RepID=UPI0015747AB7|nr:MULTISPECIES: M28 family metallopeptidase [unclassified Bacillus (in: firmicutes)]MBC6976195.1 M20/M25/M40 family metallo-hydrolase [Bacillus sp. Xin]NSW36255.1 M20/M25/M40 family metallo-hydrolase [Bacillus sp. Xin1]
MKKTWKQKIVSSLLAATLAVSLAPIGQVKADSPQTTIETPPITKQVDANRAIEHVRFLSETIGPRPGGTQSEKWASRYVGMQLKSMGYEVEYQPFAVPDQYVGFIESPLSKSRNWQAGAAPNSLISAEAVTAPLIFVPNGTKLDEIPNEVNGKIVLFERGATVADYNKQVENAVAKGAKGVLLYSLIGGRGNYGQTFNPRLTKKQSIPVFGLAYAQGNAFKEELAKKGDTILSLKARHESNLQSLNVIAKKKPKNSTGNEKAVIVSSHYDSVAGAPGANDNASGTGLVLELARAFQNVETDKEIRFIAFGSEEMGLIGSEHYVDNLSQKERDRILGVFNADMVSTNYDKAKNLYAMTPDGSTNLVTDATLNAAKQLNNDLVLHGKFGSSDHVPFTYAGIPAALFIWMGVDSWDPLIYHIEKVYHTPQDNIRENISPERMKMALDVIGTGVYDVLQKPAVQTEEKAA